MTENSRKIGVKMSVLANEIEKYIKQMLSASVNGMIEVQRGDLAAVFTCVPSQINYVLDTRFANNLGYHVESRRGGGGYIRIVRLENQNDAEFSDMIDNSMEQGLSQNKALQLLNRLVREDVLSRREGRLVASMMDADVLKLAEPEINLLRSRLFRSVLVNIMRKDFEGEE